MFILCATQYYLWSSIRRSYFSNKILTHCRASLLTKGLQLSVLIHLTGGKDGRFLHNIAMKWELFERFGPAAACTWRLNWWLSPGDSSWRLVEKISMCCLVTGNVLKGVEAWRDRRHEGQKEVFERGNGWIVDGLEWLRSLMWLYSHYMKSQSASCLCLSSYKSYLNDKILIYLVICMGPTEVHCIHQRNQNWHLFS